MRSTKTMIRGLAAGALAAAPAVAILICGPSPARAQPSSRAAPAAPAVPAEPAATAASYGDWVVRCQRGGTAEKPVRVCEVAQSMQVQGQAQPIAQIAVGRVGAGQPLQITAVLPPTVAFPSSVRVLTDEKDTTGIELPWRRCLPGACVAEATVKEEGLRRWRGASEPGRIAFKNGSDQDVSIPLSFRGFAQALDALAKEPG